MKLQNKKTGEIGFINYFDNQTIVVYPIDENWDAKGHKKYVYHCLTELDEEWEDYEEPEVGYIIDTMEEDCICDAKFGVELEDIERAKELGIWFATEEEAERAVEKLKAWKRLKDKGFRFNRRYKPKYGETFIVECRLPKETLVIDVAEDLDLLFGGEE